MADRVSEFFDTMTFDERQRMIEDVRMGVLARFPLLGTVMANLKTVVRPGVQTAATDGNVVYYAPKFFDALPPDQRIFVYAHEVMHVAFRHMDRLAGRHTQIWNLATDAVINQMLVAENLPMVDGGVDMPDAIGFSADEMYEKLLAEHQDKQKDKQNQSPSDNDGDGNSDADADGIPSGHDNHDIWSDADDENAASPSPQDVPSEKDFTQQNAREKRRIADQMRRELDAGRNRAMQSDRIRDFGDVGRAPAVTDWRRILKQTLDVDTDQWSYRRSSADNDYMARVEDMDAENRSETEVLLDVSGSVSDEFLRNFLRQLKPLLKNSDLRVGCFSDTFYPFVRIKSESDINNFRIPPRGGTNWDLAVRSFSDRRAVNKIIFTDGEFPGQMPRHDLAGKKVIWLVWGDDKDFHPNCGRVIRVTSDQNQMASMMARYRMRGR
ncbi:hypothetical protein HDR63_00410 [bacterium]|nr:hypothetical protein [bacterium]